MDTWVVRIWKGVAPDRRNLGLRTYNTVYGRLAQEINKDVGRYVPKDAVLEIEIVQSTIHIPNIAGHGLAQMAQKLGSWIAKIR